MTKIYFHISDIEVASRKGLWDNEIYETDLTNFVKLVNEIVSNYQDWASPYIPIHESHIPLYCGTNKNEVLKRAREQAIWDTPEKFIFKKEKTNNE